MDLNKEIELFFTLHPNSRKFTRPEWISNKVRFSCGKNGFGHWWPNMECRNSVEVDSWYPIIIRNSNPFKTLKGAIKFVEQTRLRIAKRDKGAA